MTPQARLSRTVAPLLRAAYSTGPAISRLPPLLSSFESDPSTSSSATPASRPTRLNGWVASIRKQKNVSFAAISDGSKVGRTQVVLPKGLEQGLTVGCSATFEGEWVQGPKSGQEFRANEVTWIGESDAQSYPIPNTKQGIPLPILRHNAHLRGRKQAMMSVMNLRSEMNWAMTNYFRSEGFIKVEAPIITSSDCEGGGEVFKVVDATPPPPPASTSSSSSSKVPGSSLDPPPSPSRYLSVSSQLHLEAIASSHPRVYALSPCFRAEKSDTARHLQEFWMLEAEMSFLASDPAEALEQVMNVAESSVRAITRHVVDLPEFEWLASTKAGLEVGLEKRTRGLIAHDPYRRMTYSEAVERLQEEETKNGPRFQFRPVWGASLQTEHEKFLAEELVKGPVFVTDYPTDLKPFYMLQNPASLRSGDSTRTTTACFDLLVPELGELAGGSLRTHSLDDLVQALKRNPNLKEEEYGWYFDLRRYGTTRHGGFGIGWERLVGLLTGMGNVRECIAFPRAGEGSRF
ncbi:hypothetical protein JCM11491_006429 [Sporobolomyces phaffii]